jgi:hypothetical protein
LGTFRAGVNRVTFCELAWHGIAGHGRPSWSLARRTDGAEGRRSDRSPLVRRRDTLGRMLLTCTGITIQA